ncbi:MAG: GntP family permease [Ignavibacteriales bacterium]|nr:GntP family permease [Ignavibacteriales bacterium]
MSHESILLFAFLMSIVFIIYFTAKVKLNAFYVLIAASIGVGIVASIPLDKIVVIMKEGFGNTLASIGLVIVFGTTLGAVLEKNGAAYSLAGYILKIVGDKRAPLAMAITGFIFGIPIFCDSGFVVLSPLNKSIAKRTFSPMSVMGAVLGVSLFSVHCLIPPHPGATAASGIIGVNLGKVILFGLLIALVSAASGYFWVKFIGKKYQSRSVDTMEDTFQEDIIVNLPSPLISFIPIFLPILLISAKSILVLFPGMVPSGIFFDLISFIGDPVIALLLGLISSLILFPKFTRETLDHIFNEGIKNAGVILLITAAGGTFGAVLKASGIGNVIGSSLSSAGLGLLLPFFVAAALKTAQGSSTVAIVTAASLISPLLMELNLSAGNSPLYTVLSMGAGSMIASHANDSYFWVVTKFSDLEVDVSLKVFSTATIIMGITAELSVLIVSRIFQ